MHLLGNNEVAAMEIAAEETITSHNPLPVTKMSRKGKVSRSQTDVVMMGSDELSRLMTNAVDTSPMISKK